MNSFWEWLEKEAVAATILIKNDKALILRRGMTAEWMPGKWNLPGGMVDPNESPKAAAIRECQEETGITPTRLTFFKTLIEATYNVHIFTGTTEQEPRLDHENDAFAWVSIKELSHYDFVPNISKEIGIILQNLP